MENILYIDDYINLYNKNINKIIVYKPYKNTLNKGRIIDREKFIKLYSKLLKEYKLNNHIFGNSIKVIINNNINKEDINLIKIVLEELNYQNIVIIPALISFVRGDGPSSRLPLQFFLLLLYHRLRAL